MRLKDIPNLRLTTREKRYLINAINDLTYKGEQVVSLKNWGYLSAVATIKTLERVIDGYCYNNEEVNALVRIVMKVTEIAEDE